MPSQGSPFRDRPPISNSQALDALQRGDLELIGRMPWSSNATYLIDVLYEDDVIQGIYKPARGERPLWDFPEGLYHREVASFELSNLLGWDIVPPTVIRDGPLGGGSIQLFIPCDLNVNYFDILKDPASHRSLKEVCIFDFVANSADRKGGHCLLDPQGKVWAIDNGLTFHVEFKLRTVIWDWAGELIPNDLLEDLQSLISSDLPNSFSHYLDTMERAAVYERARVLLETGKFPIDASGRRYPWPVI